MTVKQLAEAPHAWKHTKTFSGELWEIMKKKYHFNHTATKKVKKNQILEKFKSSCKVTAVFFFYGK